MENADYYEKLLRLLRARIEEMNEERKLVQKLLSIYSKRIEELKNRGKAA